MNKIANELLKIANELTANDDMLSKLHAYCKNAISNYEAFEDLALDKINDLRCSLQYASPELYDKMADAIEEYCDDNDIENNFDVEDVFWAD